MKSDPYRIKKVACEYKLVDDQDTAASAASLLETKLLLNSVILDVHRGARFMTADLKDFPLQSFLADPD